MTQQNKRKIEQGAAEKPVTKMDTLRDTWTVMKPFVHFSIKAMQVIASGLIFIVKHIPKPDDNKDKPKNEKVVKI